MTSPADNTPVSAKIKKPSGNFYYLLTINLDMDNLT